MNRITGPDFLYRLLPLLFPGPGPFAVTQTEKRDKAYDGGVAVMLVPEDIGNVVMQLLSDCGRQNQAV